VTTFWALCQAALDKRWTSGTCEGSAVAYVEGEATLGTLNYLLSLRHDESLRFDFQKRNSLMALLKDYGKHVLSYLEFVLAHKLFNIFYELFHMFAFNRYHLIKGNYEKV